MSSLTTLIRLLVESRLEEKMNFLGANTPKFYEKFVACLLQQLVEKIDKVREVAGRKLQEFFKYVAPYTVEFSCRD